MLLQDLVGISLGGTVGLQLGFKLVVAFREGIQSRLRLGAFHQNGVGILRIAFEGHIDVVGKKRERPTPTLQHDAVHLIVLADRRLKNGIPIGNHSRIQSLSVFLQIYHFAIGIGEVHVDLEGLCLRG